MDYVLKKAEEQKKEVKVAVNWKQYEVQYLDLTLALRYMLTQEIPRRPVIAFKEFEALKAWMGLLSRFASGTKPLRKLFHRLNEWVQNQSSETITANDWLQKFDSIQVF